MENFTKGEVQEIDDPYPFDVEDALQMRITQGSKIRNVMGFAIKKMADKEVRQITWNGSGPAVTKTITCAEIMKRKIKGLHQITKIRFKRIVEHWVPVMEGLEPLKVNRDIPAISILLSKDPLDSTEPGYQPPGNFEAFWQEKTKTDKSVRNRPRSTWKSGIRSEQMEAKRRRSKKCRNLQGASSGHQDTVKDTATPAEDFSSKS